MYVCMYAIYMCRRIYLYDKRIQSFPTFPSTLIGHDKVMIERRTSHFSCCMPTSSLYSSYP